MVNLQSRTVKVIKKTLIEKIKQNKETHIKEYQNAVVAYREEASNQLVKLQEKLQNGDIDLSLNLIKPVNNSEDYDKIIMMFEWDTNEEVEISQLEFSQYVLDELPFAVHAKLLNATYIRK